MSKNITSVDLVFENVEVYVVSKVKSLKLDPIYKIGGVDAANTYFELLRTDYALIQFDLKNLDASGSWDYLTPDLKPADHLKNNDISHLDIHYDDGTSEYVSMPWSEEDEYTNLYQKTTINNNLVQIEFKKGNAHANYEN